MSYEKVSVARGSDREVSHCPAVGVNTSWTQGLTGCGHQLAAHNRVGLFTSSHGNTCSVHSLTTPPPDTARHRLHPEWQKAGSDQFFTYCARFKRRTLSQVWLCALQYFLVDLAIAITPPDFNWHRLALTDTDSDTDWHRLIQASAGLRLKPQSPPSKPPVVSGYVS